MKSVTTNSLKNVLANSKSPYLRQHQNNPVAWQRWTATTIALAKERNIPIFLSIGYSACHWCHVMEHESFSNEIVAKALNDNFISIKIDREERPDVDRIYMRFITATNGRGGWPLNVFLTPDAVPIFGGTYWPGPNSAGAYGSIDFLSIINRVSSLWKQNEDKVRNGAANAFEQLRKIVEDTMSEAIRSDQKIGKEPLKKAFNYFLKIFDSKNGGFGSAPKFPNEVNLSCLLAIAAGSGLQNDEQTFSKAERQKALDMSSFTLSKIAAGAIHDHIAHGFARYSVTNDWSLPHFEKMSYTNSLLMGCYLDCWQLTKDEKMLDCVKDIADYFLNDALHHKSTEIDGEVAFYSAEDADSEDIEGEKKEGAFYVFDYKLFEHLLGEDTNIAAAYWNVKQRGNVNSEHDAKGELENQNTLTIIASYAQLAQKFSKTEGEISQILERCRKKIYEFREANRKRPNLDDKIVASWNGLAISSLARASSCLQYSHSEVSQRYLQAALSASSFIRKHLYNEETHCLKRVFSCHSDIQDSETEVEGLTEDYANIIASQIDLYHATFDASHLRWAHDLLETQMQLFWDDSEDGGGFFATAADAKDVILRIKDFHDGAEPSANSISVSNLIRLGSILGDHNLILKAEKTLVAFRGTTEEMPFAFPEMLKGLMGIINGVRTIVVSGNRGEQKTEDFLRAIAEKSHVGVGTVVIQVEESAIESRLQWLMGKNEILRQILKGKQGVYICEGFSCGLPIDNLVALNDKLGLEQ